MPSVMNVRLNVTCHSAALSDLMQSVWHHYSTVIHKWHVLLSWAKNHNVQCAGLTDMKQKLWGITVIEFTRFPGFSCITESNKGCGPRNIQVLKIFDLFQGKLFTYSSIMDFRNQSTCPSTCNVVTSLGVFLHQQHSDYRSNISLSTISVQLSSLLEVC